MKNLNLKPVFRPSTRFLLSACVCVSRDVLLWRREVTQMQSDRRALVRHDALRHSYLELE